MNESPWYTYETPEELLWYVHERAGDRLLRLFACACCRLIWPTLGSNAGRRAVETSESYAEGTATWQALRAAEADVWCARPSGSWLGTWAAAEAAGPDPWHAARWVPAWTAEAAAEIAARLALTREESASAEQAAEAAWEQERRSQCAALRDLFGSPSQSTWTQPHRLSWNNRQVAEAAQALYYQGRFSELSSLVPLLDAAGCDNQEILAHCLCPEPHFRGCWVFDLILARRCRSATQKPSPSWRRGQGDFPASFAAANRWRPPRASARLAA
jgi:hypothetical protein